MPKTTTKPSPKYRRQKRKGRPDDAFVHLDDQRVSLGEYGTDKRKAKYHRLLAERSAQMPGEHDLDTITIAELLAAFLKHANSYYGPKNKETVNYKLAMRYIATLFADIAVKDFGPRALKLVRQSMVDSGSSRQYINAMVRRVRHVFRWGVAEELVDGNVLHRLKAVEALKRGRTDAPDTEGVKPVPEAHVHIVENHVCKVVWAMIQTQLLTGARGGEICMMRSIDIDTTDDIWIYSPPQHKTAHHGHRRDIYIGPKCQQVVGPYLNRPTHKYMFSPQEAFNEAMQKGAKGSRRPNQKPNRTQTSRTIGQHFTISSYRRAIHRACASANIPNWSPHRLRHSAGTIVRKMFGLEAAQLYLGHANADVTQIYAEANKDRVIEVARKLG